MAIGTEGKPSASPPVLGLALSGGGLRAAFFHAGVLARLADLQVLNKVRVLSTVSGGSVVGALLYLHLKARYESEDDVPSDREIVASVVATLREAGEADLRVSAFRNPVKSLWMGLSRRFSRSDRMAELYDRYLYRDFAPADTRAWFRRFASWLGDITGLWRGRRRVRLRDLPIADDEAPLQLVINATCLNTGHGWRFEATRMGEPRRGPHTRLPAVLGRAYGIAAGRVREDQLLALLGEHHSTAIVDIKAGCPPAAVPWRSIGGTAGGDDEEGFVELPGLDTIDLPTSAWDWGVHPKVQRLLSEIRTDLDVFSEVEAHSLMLAGYRNAKAQLERPGGIAEAFGVAVTDDAAEHEWLFSNVAELILPPGEQELNQDYARQLRAAHHRFTRPLRVLPRWMQVVGSIVAVAAAVTAYVVIAGDRGAWWLAHDAWSLLTSGVPALALVIPGVLWFLPMLMPPRLKEGSDSLGRALAWGVAPFCAWPLILAHLLVSRRYCLHRGQVSRLLGP